MKKFFLLSVSLLLFANIKAQPWLPAVEKKIQQKGELTFYDIQNVVNDYYSNQEFEKGYYLKNGTKSKAPGWKQFKRWEWYWDSRVELSSGEFPETDPIREWNKYMKENPNVKSIAGDWQALGPDTSRGGYAGIGRINCISFHPSDTNTYWVGAPSGGLWKTTDDGETWTVLTDQNDVLGVSDIAIPSDYESSNTLYIATGDRDGGSVWTLGGAHYYDNHSVGVLKSTDGGSTWNPTGLAYLTNDNWIVSRVLIDTTDNQTLFAATYSGVYKSTDGGTNWDKKLISNYVIDMEFKPGDPSTIYASTKISDNAKIYRSTDYGENWTEIKFFDTGSKRVEIAVTADDPNYIYAIVSNLSGGLFGIYKSRDGGDTFEKTYNGNESNHYLLNYYSDGSGDSNTGQGNYDLAIAVAPNDTNTIYIGGINTWKSEDGGYTWNINNMWTSSTSYNFDNAPVVHADKHVLKFRDESVLFEGNDGGIYKTNNEGLDWADRTNGLVISQLYRIGVSQNSESLVIAGLQDNGTKLYTTDGVWYDIKGGDGMECIIDPNNDDIQYGTYIDGEIERTLDGWSTYNTTIISDSIEDSDGGWWVSPYMLDPNDSKTIYVGYNDVWKSTDRGDHFEKISTMNTSDNLRSMAMSPANSSVIYVADRSFIWKTEDGGTNWSIISNDLPTNYSITYLYVDKYDENRLWVTFGGYDANRVYESVDGGSTWTDISSGLPGIPVFSIIKNNLASDDHLYVGTERGVFVKENNNDWTLFSAGLPNVMVTELDIYYNESIPSQSKIRAATYGRGLWESDLLNFVTAAIRLENVSGPYYVSKDSTADFNIEFQLNETFISNTFTAFLSNEDGDFTSETKIGELESDTETTMLVSIATKTPSGNNYKIRLESSSPVEESNPSNSFEVILDTVPPSVTISSDESGTTSENPFYVNITFSESVEGFEQSDISLSNATVESFGNSNAPTYKVGLTSNTEGTVTIDVPANSAFDVVGHGNTAAAQWSIVTGIDLLEDYGIKIYPNPSNGLFRIDMADANVNKIALIDLSGRVIFQEQMHQTTSKDFDLSNLAKGIYILKLTMKDKDISSKIIIE